MRTRVASCRCKTPRGSGVITPADLSRELGTPVPEGNSSRSPRASRTLYLSWVPRGGRDTCRVHAWLPTRVTVPLAPAHHGARCSVCDMDLGRMYGPIAAGYIHVHHLKPVSVGPRRPIPVR